MFWTVEVTTTLPSGVTSAAGMYCVGSGLGDPIARAVIRSRPAPVRLSSRYSVRCDGGGAWIPLCQSKATWPLPTHDTPLGHPLALVVHVLTAPLARVTTRIPVYWQVLALQDCTSIASLVPSGDSATSATERLPGTLSFSLDRLAERPWAATRSR